MSEILIVVFSLVAIVLFMGFLILSSFNKQKINLSGRILASEDQYEIEEKLRKIKEEEAYQKDDSSLNWIQKKERELIQSNTGITISVYLAMVIGSCSVICFLAFKILNNIFFTIPFSLIGLLIPPLIIKGIRTKKIAEFDASLIKVMRRMSANMRAGNSLTQALEDIIVAKSLPEIVRNEFKKVLSDLRVGKSNKDAFFDLYCRTGSKEIQFLAIAIDVQTTKGGNLSDTFDRISMIISDKFIVEGDIKSTMAQLSASSNILIALPIFIPCLIFFVSPSYFDPLLTNLGGRIFVIICFTVIAFGAFVIKKMSKIDF